MIEAHWGITYPNDPDARKVITGFQAGQADPVTKAYIGTTLVKMTLADADANKDLVVLLKGVGHQLTRVDALDVTGAVKATAYLDSDYGCPPPSGILKSITWIIQ